MDWKHADGLMDSKFSLGRKEVIEDKPLVKDIQYKAVIYCIIMFLIVDPINLLSLRRCAVPF